MQSVFECICINRISRDQPWGLELEDVTISVGPNRQKSDGGRFSSSAVSRELLLLIWRYAVGCTFELGLRSFL